MSWISRWAIVIAACWVAAGAVAEPFDEALYTRTLQRHTREVSDLAGVRVDYRGLAASPDWRGVVASLAASDPESLQDRDEKLALWINAYNILAIDLVVANRPTESIRDIGSFLRPVWKRDAGRVGGRLVSLDRIEHAILRPMGEPRIHAAVVCASLSCPSLLREAWSAQRLEVQFATALQGWLGDPRKGARVDAERRTLYLSRIFDWFEADFEAVGGVSDFVGPYLTAADRAWLAANPQPHLRYLDYDWRLNALPEPKPGS